LQEGRAFIKNKQDYTGPACIVLLFGYNEDKIFIF